MVNVTQYLVESGKYKKGIIQNFLRMQRTKYFIADGEKVVTKSGRYGGYTLFSERLFEVYKLWLERKPIPLLNRKEFEVGWFLNSLLDGNIIPQYRVGGYIYDWYAPSLDILIEFNERDHSRSRHTIDNDLKKLRPDLFVINEETVMQDLAQLAKLVFEKSK